MSHFRHFHEVRKEMTATDANDSINAMDKTRELKSITDIIVKSRIFIYLTW